MSDFAAAAAHLVVLALLAGPAGADDPPKTPSGEERGALVAKRTAEVQQLRATHDALKASFAHPAQTLLLAREARQQNLVRAGERLYVVTGIQRWRHSHPGAH